MNKPGLLKMACILFVFCTATAIASPAQVLTTLHNFQGSPGDGANPEAGLLHASDGNFYGTTFGGGANKNGNCISNDGCGTVFKITPGGTLTVLYSFCSQPNCSDGADPEPVLVQSGDGNFYGTTEVGGTGTECFYGTCGTVFKITPQGTLTTLYSFCSQSNCDDGAAPSAPVVQGSDGNFYGTTFNGGISCSPVGCGTVFKITPGGSLTTLHRFNVNDGYWPYTGLVQGSDGNFYGTTNLGGIDGVNGQGTVFKMTPGGTLTTLYSFCSQSNCSDGGDPYGALVLARDGNFYGVASGGGANGDGTAFKITPTCAYTTLHSFAGASDGAYPYATLVQATDGNFYGTTFEGGTHDAGTIFKMTPAGSLTTLHNFAGPPSDGSLSTASLVQLGTSLYGAAGSGGNSSYGTVFRITLPRLCTVCPNAE